MIRTGSGEVGELGSHAAGASVARRGSATRPSFAVVYHRAPTDADPLIGAPAALHSPNGIIPTLRGIFGPERAGVWVAWTRVDDAGDLRNRNAAPAYSSDPAISVHSVPLSASDIETFYHRFSKEALWPVICSSPDNVRFEESHWDAFAEVNRRFAEAVAELVTPDATIWVHDYNLWLVPGVLRELMPAARIGFFHHTPFPAADVFAILPWRAEILRSLLACDLVGFHVPHYANNFAATAANLVGARVSCEVEVSSRYLTVGTPLSTSRTAAELEFGARRIALNAYPVGIDSARIDDLRATPGHARRVEAIGRALPGQQVVLSIDRLDYVKGSVQKLGAYERLLQRHPEYRGVIAFVCIVAPAVDAISVHRSVRAEIDALVGRINGRFSTLAWTPVRYFYQPLSFARVVSWYEASSIAWIAPLRDGLNLVAKEFVAASGDDAKVLLLSEFAGAHVELKHAVTVNPYSPRSMDLGLQTALDMPAAARRRRMRNMRRVVRSSTADQWATEFLAELVSDRPATLGAGVTRTAAATPSIAPHRAPAGSS